MKFDGSGGHHGQVTSIQLTKDSRRMVTSGLDRVIVTWCTETNTSLSVFPVMQSISGMIIQPQGLQFPNVDDSKEG